MVGTDRAGLHETMSDGRGDGEAVASCPGRPRFLAARPALVGNDNHPGEQWREATDRQSEAIAAPELDCLRGVLSPALLQAAARRARDLDIGADSVLIQQGLIEEEAYLRYLARRLRLGFEDFGAFDRADCPLEDAQISSATATGIVPLRVDGELIWVVAPRHLASHRLCGLLDDYPDTRRGCDWPRRRIWRFFWRGRASARWPTSPAPICTSAIRCCRRRRAGPVRCGGSA